MADNLKPGSDIKITITKTPQTKAARETVRRLMLSATEHRTAMAHANNTRRINADWRSRAGRLWNNRPKVARVILGRKGETSTIKYRPQIANDLRSVERFISVEQA